VLDGLLEADTDLGAAQSDVLRQSPVAGLCEGGEPNTPESGNGIGQLRGLSPW